MPGEYPFQWTLPQTENRDHSHLLHLAVLSLIQRAGWRRLSLPGLDFCMITWLTSLCSMPYYLRMATMMPIPISPTPEQQTLCEISNEVAKRHPFCLLGNTLSSLYPKEECLYCLWLQGWDLASSRHIYPLPQRRPYVKVSHLLYLKQQWLKSLRCAWNEKSRQTQVCVEHQPPDVLAGFATREAESDFVGPT